MMARGYGMALLAAISVAYLIHSSSAQTTYTVGDTTGWTIPPTDAAFYSTWAANNTFKVGDILVFDFGANSHDVAVVTKANYDACNSSSPITLLSTPPVRITINASGEHYYFCSFPGHCSAGQKLMINVSDASPSPAPQPSTAPQIFPSPPQPAPQPSTAPKIFPSPPQPAPQPSTAPKIFPSPAPQPSTTPKIVIATVVSSLAVAVALLLFWYFSCWKGPRRTEERSEEILSRENSNHSYLNEGWPVSGHDNSEKIHHFSLKTIMLATNNFSDANKLGEGGFGPVYKGTLPDGEEIAVKRLCMTSKQGLEEFRNEVMVIAKLQHKNLVRLLGYCLEGDEKLLVYEYLANTSLDSILFDPKKSTELDWPKRANIISGTARGLQYLHEDSRLKIIHRDMKASNVLLDDQMNPKISDFGTARIFGGDQLEANTNKVVGTFGYMAPEYALEGIISTKSDVYSFGILLLEIITGKKSRGFYSQDQAQSLLFHAWQLWNEGRGQELIDRNVVSGPIGEALRWIHIALLCVQDDPARRPTMSLVVLMLGSNAVNLPQPSVGPNSLVKFTSILSHQSSASVSGSSFLASDQSGN